MPTPEQLQTIHPPTWCPGCGNHSMWKALRQAISEMGWASNEFSMVWGIGCHGNGADFTLTQGMHALHGRALPPATALAMTRPDLHVIAEVGDGDCYGLGMGHFIHTLRRNPNMTIIAHDNQVYGLTTGQASPTTEHLMPSVSTPGGVLEQPANPIGLALAENATFVARGFAGDVEHLVGLYKQAFEHKGLALVDVLQPCVTWNKLNTAAWFRDRIYKLEETDWDASNRSAAFDLSMAAFREMTCTPDECRIPIGVIYRQEGVPTYEDGITAASTPGWRRASVPRDVSALVDALS
ncbi:MAG: 2-oxoacid ferredoxin oxidoreductase [Coriobacteriia bacterium]|nr:2-oxoacid ferredoxin oxidoreductase [Coriobacteriia bacterium]